MAVGRWAGEHAAAPPVAHRQGRGVGRLNDTPAGPLRAGRLKTTAGCARSDAGESHAILWEAPIKLMEGNG